MTNQLQYNNSIIYYDSIGEGKPAVLLHGFGEDRSVWRYQVPVLSGNFRLIIPDLPGTGSSGSVDDMSIEGLADVVYAIMQKENIERCPVIGHSMGGYITLALVEKYGDHVSGFGLFHSSSYADSEEKKANRQKGIDFIKEHSAPDFLKTMIPTLFSLKTREENQALIDEQLAGIHNFSAPALVSYYQAMMNRPDRTYILSESTVPVLFVIGKSDVAIPVEDSLKQCHLPGISYIHMMHDSGHMGMLEEKEKTNTLLKEFLMEV